jgi:arginine deiminase
MMKSLEVAQEMPTKKNLTDTDNTKETINLNINSEIGQLKTVLLHRPGNELGDLTSDVLKTTLFGETSWLKQIREEHDKFADLLRSRGTNVRYVDEMLTQVLQNDAVKEKFVLDLLTDSHIENADLRGALFEMIRTKPAEKVTETAIAGLRKKDVEDLPVPKNLWDYINQDNPLYINPIPNICFMRDPAAVIGDGISINRMYTGARRREPRIIHYIYRYHPAFRKTKKTVWYDETLPNSIEGGDMLALSERAVAIGCSQRTSPGAIERIARNLFGRRETLKEILAVRIPAAHAFMHLDTILTMIDYDKFAVYPGLCDRIQVYKLTRRGDGGIRVMSETDLASALKKSLRLPAVDLIPAGDESAATGSEYRNNSTNALAIAPSVVVTYCKNERSNEALRRHGVYVLEIGNSKLVEGRGGSRCLCCPLERKEL